MNTLHEENEPVEHTRYHDIITRSTFQDLLGHRLQNGKASRCFSEKPEITSHNDTALESLHSLISMALETCHLLPNLVI